MVGGGETSLEWKVLGWEGCLKVEGRPLLENLLVFLNISFASHRDIMIVSNTPAEVDVSSL